jgi:radical SAM protein with 4Fe4S-binding SPASM domain
LPVGENLPSISFTTPAAPEHSGKQPGPMLCVKKCRDPWEFLFVDVHGNIRVCCTSHRLMGNILETPLETIWNSPAYQEFRAKMVSPEIPAECQTCLRREWQMIPAKTA